MKTVLTYGTFDLFHVGHLNILERLAAMGDRLIVGVSTDEFNLQKGKRSVFSFSDRSRIVAAMSCVSSVIPEENWQQKIEDIQRNNVGVFGMGSDWEGKFDHLKEYCEVAYLPRTENVSTTTLRATLSQFDSSTVETLKQGLDDVMTIVRAME